MRAALALTVMLAGGCSLFDAAGDQGGDGEECESGEEARTTEATS